MMFRDKYAFLSNFYPSPIRFGDSIAPTVEHGYQAAKTLKKIERETILSAATPGKAKRLGAICTLRKDWGERKLAVMEELLRRKFENPILRAQLKEITVDIAEDNNWGDAYWGVVCGVGENNLGKLLMKVRDE